MNKIAEKAGYRVKKPSRGPGLLGGLVLVLLAIKVIAMIIGK